MPDLHEGFNELEQRDENDEDQSSVTTGKGISEIDSDDNDDYPPKLATREADRWMDRLEKVLKLRYGKMVPERRQKNDHSKKNKEWRRQSQIESK